MSGKQAEANMKLGELLKQKIAAIDYPKLIDGFDISIEDYGTYKSVKLCKRPGYKPITIKFSLHHEEHAVPCSMNNNDISEVTPKPFTFTINIENRTKYCAFVHLDCSYFGIIQKEDKYCFKISKMHRNEKKNGLKVSIQEIEEETLQNAMLDFLIENGVTDKLFKTIYKHTILYNSGNFNNVKALHDVLF